MTNRVRRFQTTTIGIILVAVTAACGIGEEASPEATGSPQRGANSSAMPALPGDPGYRARLGEYADVALGDGLVPFGSVEYNHWVGSCIEAAGFGVEIHDDGYMVRQGEQEDAANEAVAQCRQAAVDSGLIAERQPPDADDFSAWYDAYQLTYDCLKDHGYPVSTPPSRDAYIDSEGVNWHPYEQIDPSEIAQIESQCPQDPLVLFEMLASGEQP